MLKFGWVLSLLFIYSSCQAEAVAWGNKANWQSRSSEHFIIHFPAAFDKQAIQALAIAEQVHIELLPFFYPSLQKKTELVLVDDYDYSNGWATALPFNQIRLYINPPESVAGLEHTDDWLHGLILHEYVHILHLDMAAGANTSLGRVFGRLPWLFPHQFTPSLFKEGLAIYLETDETQGYGRLDGSYLPMQMRAELLSNEGDQLNQVVIPRRDWPTSKAYLYGAYFFKFLAEKYGEDKVRWYLHAYSHEIIPYIFQNRVAKAVFGKDFNALWQDYLNWLSITIKIPAHSSHHSVLTTSANSQQITAASEQGLWHIEANGEDRAKILLWQGAQQPVSFGNTKNVSDIDVATDGTLAVSRLIPYASGQAFNDLFLWHQDKGWQRLTHKQRFTQVRWLNNGQLIASRKVGGVSELWQLDRQGHMHKLWQGEYGESLGSFAVHPSGTSLVSSIKRLQRGWNLESFNLQTRSWQPVTQTQSIEHQPEYLADGRLLFSADYRGVFNIYLLEPSTGNLQQLTQTATGAFKPHLINQQLYFQQYSSKGFQLSHQPITVYAESNLAAFDGQYSYVAQPQHTEVSAIKPYSAWPSVLPKYWFPFIALDEHASLIGIGTDGSDALWRHSYSFNYARDIRNDLNEAQLLYQYDNRWMLFARRDHSHSSRLVNNVEEHITFQNDKFIAQRNHLHNAFEDQLQLHLGVSVDNQRLVNLPNHLMATVTRVSERLAGAAISFDNREKYRQVPSIGWGTYAHLVYETADLINNDFSGYRNQTGLQHWFDLPGRSTFKIGLQAGISSDSMLPFTIGGSKTKDENLLFNRSQYSLPGYPSQVQLGQYYYLTEARYNQWLARVERNLGFWPLGLGDISLSAWAKNAKAWQAGNNVNSLFSLGLEVNVEAVLGYQVLVPLTLGVAQGLDKNLGETQGYLELQLAF